MKVQVGFHERPRRLMEHGDLLVDMSREKVEFDFGFKPVRLGFASFTQDTVPLDVGFLLSDTGRSDTLGRRVDFMVVGDVHGVDHVGCQQVSKPDQKEGTTNE